MVKFTDKQIEKIISLYTEGYPSITIAKEFSCSGWKILEILRANKVKIKGISFYRKIHNKIVLPKTNTKEFKYWIGFILADGCVSQADKYSKVFSMGLCKIDFLHLKKLISYLDTDYAIHENRFCYNIAIRDNDFCELLMQYNVIPRKSLITKVPIKLKNSIDFWRGMVDGDGCLTVRQGYPSLALVGTKNICTNFKVFLKQHDSTIKNVKIRPKANIFEIRIGGKRAVTLARILYKDSAISLDRKNKIYEDWENKIYKKASDYKKAA